MTKTPSMEHDWPEREDTAPAAERRDHAPTLADDSYSRLLAELRLEFTGAAYPVALEVVEFLHEKGQLGRQTARQQNLTEVVAKFLKIFRYIAQHPTRTAIYAAFYVWSEPLFDDLNGNMTQVEFAASIGVTKAAVNNAVKDAQKFFGVPPRQDQRKPEACENMRRAIIQRLEGVK